MASTFAGLALDLAGITSDAMPMGTQSTEPIVRDWTPEQFDHLATPSFATAAQVNERLARLEVSDVGAHLVPFLAAATAEVALGADIAWRLSTDDPAVALVRMIAKVAINSPDVGGPHTARLHEQLVQRPS